MTSAGPDQLASCLGLWADVTEFVRLGCGSCVNASFYTVNKFTSKMASGPAVLGCEGQSLLYYIITYSFVPRVGYLLAFCSLHNLRLCFVLLSFAGVGCGGPCKQFCIFCMYLLYFLNKREKNIVIFSIPTVLTVVYVSLQLSSTRDGSKV